MRSQGRYRLRINLEVEQLDERGQFTNRGLTIAESLDLVDVQSFMEIAFILSQFHELGQQIEKDRALPDE